MCSQSVFVNVVLSVPLNEQLQLKCAVVYCLCLKGARLYVLCSSNIQPVQLWKEQHTVCGLMTSAVQV